MTELWELLQFLFLGLFQGFTEPIPISSSGHLKIVQAFMDLDLPGGLTFEAFINFGSLLAVLVVYGKASFHSSTMLLTMCLKRMKNTKVILRIYYCWSLLRFQQVY